MIFDSFPVFLPAEYRVKFATEVWERRQAAALRRKVFCEEQGIFANDDRDAIDESAIPLVAISSLGVTPDGVVGTVRIHEAEPACGGAHALPLRLPIAASARSAPH